MITLDAATKSLEIRLGSAVSTAQPQFVVAYTDIGQVNQQVVSMAESDGVTNDTTAVTLLAAPDAGNSRVVRYLSVFNADDADVEVRISVNNNSTIREVLWITLTPDQTLEFAQGQWGVINVAGDFQPLSTKLTSLSLLDGGADKLPYFSGENTFSQTDFTAFARGFLALTDEPYREILGADIDFYVNATTGSDSYNGLSATDDGDGVGPFATIQAGIDAVSMLDLSIYDATINVADGTYTDAIVLKTLVGAGTCFIVGNTDTLGNVLIDSTEARAIDATGYGGAYDISGLKVQTTGGYCVWCDNAYLRLGNNDWGASNSAHVVTLNGAYVQMYEGYTISAGSQRHIFAVDVSTVQFPAVGTSETITLVGTPAFTTAYAVAQRQGYMYVQGGDFSFSGSATGVRFICENATIYGQGPASDLDYFPGDEDGTISVNGVYRDITADSETGITASTTQTQAGATTLTTTMNAIGTVANPNDAIGLPSAIQGLDVYMINNGANNAEIWPASGDSIQGAAVNAADPVVLAPDESRHYKAVDDTQWLRVQ